MRSFMACLALLYYTSAVAFEPNDFDKGGVFHIPAGTFELTRSYAPPRNKPFVVEGEGPGVTILKLVNDLPEDEALFKIAGDTKGDRINTFAKASFRNLTIVTDEPNGMDKPGRRATAIHFHLTFATRLDRVEILGFDGPGIRGTSMWDGCFTDVHVARCGRPADKLAAVHLDDIVTFTKSDGKPMTNAGAWGTCNNCHFLACRFENGPGVLTYLGKSATKNQFVACKWHGQLPSDGSVSAPHDHIQVVGYSNTFMACNVVRSGGNGIRLSSLANGTIISGCTLQANEGYGIFKEDKKVKVKDQDNVFPEGWEPKNGKGDRNDRLSK